MALRFLGTAQSRAVRATRTAFLPALLAVSCNHGPTAPSAQSVTSVTVALVAVSPGYQATAVAALSDGSSREVTAEAEWTSSNPAVATVSVTGRVMPVSAGSAEIRASYQTITGSASLSVSGPTTLSPNYRFSGTILDAVDREPVYGVRVNVFSDDHSVDTFVWTDARGGYEITASSASPTLPVTILAGRDGYSSQTVRRVASGGELMVDFSLDPLPFALSGYVKDLFDGNVPKCEPTVVEVIDGPDAGRSTVVRRVPADGWYELPSLQPGTFKLRASAPGYYISEVTARFRGFAPFNTANFSLPRGPQPADGRPVDCSLPPLQ